MRFTILRRAREMLLCFAIQWWREILLVAALVIAIASSIDLNGGTIQDAAGNDAESTFTPPDSSQVLVDGIVPTINAVVFSARGLYDGGSYGY